jgi:hypothetical protein
MNELNCFLLYFPEENPKQLDQDEFKASDPEWHEEMVNAKIDIFKYLMKNLCLISSV